MLCFINEDKFPLPLINTKLLRGNILSVLWQEMVRRTVILYTNKFDSSKKKQMRDFLEDRGNCYLNFPRKQIKLSRISEKFW